MAKLGHPTRKSKLLDLMRKLSSPSSVSSPVSSSVASTPPLTPSGRRKALSSQSQPHPPEGDLLSALADTEKLLAEALKDFAPAERISVSEWADRHFYLSTEYGDGGKWRTASFQREPFDAVSDPKVECVVIRAATQMLKTSCVQLATCWAIDVDPGPILIIQPRGEDAEKFSKERITPMFRDTPQLKGKVVDDKAKKSNNTIDTKWFRGGMLGITSSGSANNLARRTIRYLFCDEEDGWVETVGSSDPFSLAKERTARFRHRKKIIRCCSPTYPGSPIDRAYAESDRREFYVPCPDCGYFQSMMDKFDKQVRWEPDPIPERLAEVVAGLPERDRALFSKAHDEDLATWKLKWRASTARYYCENCNSAWDDAKREAAVEKGEWRAHAPFTGTAGFWINALYAPWKPLSEIVYNFLSSKDNTARLVGFINTNLAQNWVEHGERPDWRRLISEREDYPVGTAPIGVTALTAGVDIQKDRIEVEVVGWGRFLESWSIQYEILEGDTSEAGVWRQLDEFLIKTFLHASGQFLPIARVFVDSSGLTNEVYRWAMTQPPHKVTVIKGDDHSAMPIGPPRPCFVSVNGKKVKTSLFRRHVRVSEFKQQLYSWLAKSKPTNEQLQAGVKLPVGYCHFPSGKNYGDEHFKQLCAELRTAHRDPRKGTLRHGWNMVYSRNEALDCRIYARAAAYDLGVDHLQPVHWDKLESNIRRSAAVEQKRALQEKIAGSDVPRPESASTPSGAPPPADPNAYWRERADEYWSKD